MPWNVITDEGSRTEREILKFAMPMGTPIRSVVIKASSVAARPTPDTDAGYDGLRVLLRGQILAKDTVDATKYVPYTAAVGQTPAGVLDNDVEFLDGTSASNEAANMLFTGAIFHAGNLIGYTGNEAAVAAALPGCRFE